jgi:hypothetical protein
MKQDLRVPSAHPNCAFADLHRRAAGQAFALRIGAGHDTVNTVPRTSTSLSGVLTTKAFALGQLRHVCLQTAAKKRKAPRRTEIVDAQTCRRRKGDAGSVVEPERGGAVSSVRTLSPTARTPKIRQGCAPAARTS